MTARVVRLREPVVRRTKAGDPVETLAEITLRPPKLGDLVAAMDAAGGSTAVGTLTLHLAARCSGLTPGELGELGLLDGAEVMEAVAGFMPPGLRAGTDGSM